MGEKAVFSTMAHTFQIDPETKRKWLPTSSSAVRVSYYHDPGRKTYRIIAIENTKALINSTITANMTFTKTSPKFGQWSDHRANTVFGLGFGSERDLLQFSEKFQEAKAAAKALLEERKRMKKKEIELPPAASPATASPSNGGTSTAMSSAASPTPLKMEEDGVDKESEREKEQDLPAKKHDAKRSTLDHHTDAGSSHSNSVGAAASSSSSSAANGSMQAEEVDGALKHFVSSSSIDSQLETLKSENSKLKVALASSAQNVKKWETEMQTLRNNNTMLTTALEESTQHVSEWKRQLQKYKEECDSWKKRVERLEQEKATMVSQEDMVEITKENEELKEVLSAVQLDLERETTEHFAKENECSAISEKLKLVEEENQRLKREHEELLRQQAAAKLAADKKIASARDRHREIGEKLSELLALHKAASSSLEL